MSWRAQQLHVRQNEKSAPISMMDALLMAKLKFRRIFLVSLHEVVMT